MKFFLRCIKLFIFGIIFGIANVIPGVSGGTMLVVFGIYDELTEAISGIKAIFKHLGFLIPLGLGAVAGIFGFSVVVKWLFENFGLQTNMFFIGLILGSVPLIVKIGTSEQKAKPACIIPFLIAMAVVVGLSILQRADIVNLTEQTVEGFDIIFTIKIMLCAMLAAVTMIIPGVSGSFVMMLLGIYQTVIDSITQLRIMVLIPFAIGAAAGIIGGAKLISVLISKYKLTVYSAIMGLVVGSVYAILPEDFGFTLQTGYGFVCLFFGIIAAVLIERLGRLGEEQQA